MSLKILDPQKKIRKNSEDLVIYQSILRKKSPLPSNSTDLNSISDTSATSCQTSADEDSESPEMKDQKISKSEKWHMQGYSQKVQLTNESLSYLTAYQSYNGT